MNNQVYPEERIVITGIGLTAPNGNNLKEFRESLLAGKSGVQKFETRYYVEVLALEQSRFIVAEKHLMILGLTLNRSIDQG